jgi:carbonic anhydrase/acetyltransferase-like protein (isoleucine patch superfamily)
MQPHEAERPKPAIAADAIVAASAVVVGDVRIGPGCVVDHGAMIIATGAPIELESSVVVMPGALIRSTGSTSRPYHSVKIGEACLIGPQAVLAGCEIRAAVYVATQVMVFHGAVIGEGCRLGAGSIVHTNAKLQPRSRLGMRQYAVASPDGGPATITGDLDQARKLLAESDFFGRVFDIAPTDQEDLVELHRRTARTVADEIRRRHGY